LADPESRGATCWLGSAFGGRQLSGGGTELRARAELAAKCRSCGTCRSVCPVFAEVGTEGSVARGKVALIRSVLDGDLELSEIFEDRVLLCLNCKTCVANCPNDVAVDELILAARHDLVESGRLPIVRKLIFRLLLKRGRLLPPLGRLGSFAQRWLLRGLPDSSPIRIMLPLAGVDEHRVFPTLAPRSFMADAPEEVKGEAGSGLVPVAGETGSGLDGKRSAVPGTAPASHISSDVRPDAALATNERRRVVREARRVAYFVGCATNLIYPGTGRATVDALARSGVDVSIPRAQICCGAPALNSGDYDSARAMARRNIAVLRETGADAVVTGCASCGLSLKREYERTLGLDGGIGLPVFDLAEFLALRGRGTVSEVGESRDNHVGAGESPESGGDTDRTLEAGRGRVAHPLTGRRLRVAFHDPCHLVRGQKVTQEPRDLLRSLPWVEYVEMRNADRCCGGGGTFFLSHYDISKGIAQHKVEAIREADVDIVATECPVCIMQLTDMLEQAGVDVAVVSVADVLAMGGERGAA